ncbi:hypothetical protein P154DRAFT_575794 [Amniculicola lignicola CBS 123094]|uniref:Secreted protein n=1 Tax=Amniculicola lignicola CBS 123094 TaxID=1392246 RepID=A0A6A5WFS0_9PLEO|nr:hypothetical protein P154DRAFT_575794 [Amniculicola lignicola CBS 123094]
MTKHRFQQAALLERLPALTILLLAVRCDRGIIRPKGAQLADSGGGCFAHFDGQSEADAGLNSASRATSTLQSESKYQAEGILLNPAPATPRSTEKHIRNAGLLPSPPDSSLFLMSTGH